jgi:hypothetical protein
MLFMNRLEFSCFTDFFVCIFKTRVEYGFLQNPPEERTVNSIEQKTGVCCQIDVQESISGWADFFIIESGHCHFVCTLCLHA